MGSRLHCIMYSTPPVGLGCDPPSLPAQGTDRPPRSCAIDGIKGWHLFRVAPKANTTLLASDIRAPRWRRLGMAVAAARGKNAGRPSSATARLPQAWPSGPEPCRVAADRSADRPQRQRHVHFGERRRSVELPGAPCRDACIRICASVEGFAARCPRCGAQRRSEGT